jgi:cytochrome P450
VATTEPHAASTLTDTPFPSADTTKCPYPFYEALHEQAPIHRLPTGEYVLSRHADIFHVTRHPEIFSSRHTVNEDGWMRASQLTDLEREDIPWAIVSSDPPKHTEKRKLAFEMFKPGRLRTRDPMVRQYTDELIDRFIDRGECEFVGEFADLLPAQVILTLFGLPLDHLERAIGWGRYEGFGTRFASQEKQAGAREGINDLGAFLRALVLERLETPTDDDLSVFVQRHKEHYGDVDMPGLISDVSNLFIGGIITTTHLLSSMMMLFIQHPDQQAIARQGGTALKRAIEEALRYESPVQFGPRLVTEDTEIDGVAIPKGSIVLLVWGAANRDKCVFPDADKFDVERPNAKDHMAFGNGTHFCMGAPLGRMEVMIAFEQIFARMSNLRFAEGKNDFENHHAVIFRGPTKLHIEFDKSA